MRVVRVLTDRNLLGEDRVEHAQVAVGAHTMVGGGVPQTFTRAAPGPSLAILGLILRGGSAASIAARPVSSLVEHRGDACRPRMS